MICAKIMKNPTIVTIVAKVSICISKDTPLHITITAVRTKAICVNYGCKVNNLTKKF